MKKKFLIFGVPVLMVMYLLGYSIYRTNYYGIVYRIISVPTDEGVDAVGLVENGNGIRVSESPRALQFIFMPMVKCEENIIGTKYY